MSADLRVIASASLPVPIDEGEVERRTTALRRSIPALRPQFNEDFSTLIDIELDGPIPDMDRADAISRVETSLAPVGSEPVVALLQRLRLTTAGRGLDTRELAATFRLYADRLGRFPRDVVLAVCAEDGHSWFPPLADLVIAAERLARPRRLMLAALQRKAPLRLPEPPTPTAKDEAYVAELVRRTTERLRSGGAPELIRPKVRPAYVETDLGALNAILDRKTGRRG